MLSRRPLIGSGLSVAAAGSIGYGLWPGLEDYRQEIERQRRMRLSDPAMKNLAHAATLAANGHNAQPWKFRLQGRVIEILPDFSRRTLIVDPDDHHLYISLGCAAENLAIAARANGYSPEVRIVNGTETILEIDIKSGTVASADLYKAIPFRQSTRSVYDGQPVSNSDIGQLKTAAQVSGVSVLIITDSSDRDKITEFVVEGNSAQMDSSDFVAELKKWLRFSPNQALSSRDGLFSACSGNPVVPEWMGNLVFDMFFKKESENDKYRDHIRSSSGIAVFIGDQQDPEHWIKVGRSFQRFALQATAMGIRNAHINQPIEVPRIRSEFASWLGSPQILPDLIVRFGRAPALPMSLRRSPDQVIV